MTPNIIAQVRDVLQALEIATAATVLLDREKFRRVVQRLSGLQGHRLADDLALQVAFALVALEGFHMNPVSPYYYNEVRRRFLAASSMHSDYAAAEHCYRAPEFVVAFLLGWDRCSGPGLHPGSCPSASWHLPRRELIDMTSTDWNGYTLGARQTLDRIIGRCVDRCLMGLEQNSWLHGMRPTMPQTHATTWAHLIGDAFIAHKWALRCPCWVENVDCRLRHNIDMWKPGALEFWKFCQQAFKGTVDQGFAPETFVTSMAREVMRFADNQRVAWDQFAQRQCPQCGFVPDLLCHGGYQPRQQIVRGCRYFVPEAELVHYPPQKFVPCGGGNHIIPANFSTCPLANCSYAGTATDSGKVQDYRCRS